MTVEAIVTGDVAEYDGLGMVRFVVRPTSRKVSLRWKGDHAVANIPPMMTRSRIDPVIKSMIPRFSARVSASRLYDIGTAFDIDGWSILIESGVAPFSPNGLQGVFSGENLIIYVGERLDCASVNVQKAISGLICRAARARAERVLLPEAMAIARETGVSPSAWKISHGHRTLGTCNSRRCIALSYVNVLLPRELRRYIVCHELAHLSEMNHSERFHRICDAYCGGRERELVARLKRYRWAIQR